MRVSQLLRQTPLLLALGVSLTVALAVASAQVMPSASKPSTAAKPSDDLHDLWTANIDPILARTVHTSAEAYNAGGMLMVPLHAAFRRNDLGWEKGFSEHFQRLMHSTGELPDVVLSRLQYLYLASEFIVLAQRSGHSDLIPPALPNFLYSQIYDIWMEQPSGGYEHAPFHGMRERVLWKLNTKRVTKSHSRAILDDEFFLWGIAADLRTYGNPEQQQAWRSVLNDMLEAADRVCRHEITHTSFGGWLLQPGVWRDHPDFKYAGIDHPTADMRPAPVADIAWDSSHSIRFPVWMTSLMNAYGQGSPENIFYSELREGLSKQFFARVVVPPSADFPCYRTNNYMDGRNGVYRWGYGELGANNGYGPYQASGALLLGWWALLHTPQSKELYRSIADEYPWTRKCIELYLGPGNGNREYTEGELSPNHPSMRLRYLIVRLASEL